jgi:hypothetical protein
MDGQKINLLIIDDMHPRHRREVFPSPFDSWCDAGDHPVKEGELITRHEKWQGYVHWDCLPI